MSAMDLMRAIRECRVPSGTAAIWWLGQNGYIFKSPEGVTLGVDLYLTDSCRNLNPALNLARRVPVFIEPEDLRVDVFACTHNHLDHADPETIGRLRIKETAQFVGPHPCCQVFREKGVDAARILPAWPDCRLEFGDLTLHGTFAIPTDDSDLNHMGFVLRFGTGPAVWITGDTDWSDLLASAARFSPDLMIVCINGGFNNLSHYEAATLASRVKPRVAVPCHYDLFADNSVDPGQFRASLAVCAPDVAYRELEHGKLFLLQAL